ARRVGLQRLEPRQERRDADAAGDPDLLRLAIAARDVEAAVRTLDAHFLARAQAPREAVGVVAECLDLEAHGAVAAVGAGDRERVSALVGVEGDERELPGT